VETGIYKERLYRIGGGQQEGSYTPEEQNKEIRTGSGKVRGSEEERGLNCVNRFENAFFEKL